MQLENYNLVWPRAPAPPEQECAPCGISVTATASLRRAVLFLFRCKEHIGLSTSRGRLPHPESANRGVFSTLNHTQLVQESASNERRRATPRQTLPQQHVFRLQGSKWLGEMSTARLSAFSPTAAKRIPADLLNQCRRRSGCRRRGKATSSSPTRLSSARRSRALSWTPTTGAISFCCWPDLGARRGDDQSASSLGADAGRRHGRCRGGGPALKKIKGARSAPRSLRARPGRRDRASRTPRPSRNP